MKLDWKQIKGDLFGGLTAGIVALPLALAFGNGTELGPIAGLYGAIFLGLFAAIFGGTKTQISGPTGPMTVVSTGIIMYAINELGSIEGALPLIIATFFIAGLMQVILGLLGIGKLIKYIPYPVVSGFMSGIGVIIIILQIFPLFGIVSPKGILNILSETPRIISEWNPVSFLLGVATIAIIFLFPKITKAVPGSLVALLVITGIAAGFGMNVPVIGDIPKGLPELHLSALVGFDISHLGLMLEWGITLALLGAIDSLLTSVVADNITRTKHDSKRELIGQGIGNMAAAIVGGLPGAGATMRTVVNINSGGRKRLSGIVHSLFLLIVLLGAGTYAALIPNAVLAGILITVGIKIIDYKGIKHMFKVPATDALVMVAVLILTVFVDLLTAVGIGMVMAALLFMKRSSDAVEKNSFGAPSDKFKKDLPWKDEKDIPEFFKNNVYVKHLEGPFFFGFVSKFQELVKMMPEMRFVVIRMELVPYIDQSGLYALEEAISELETKGKTVLLTGLRSQPRARLEKINIIPGMIDNSEIFDSFKDCINWIRMHADAKESAKQSADKLRSAS